ncbi:MULTISPECIES: UDP-N-acetyl glucosamine 2-epimerase [unclassified Clostridium]|uniref:UDP-N-acetyl glucosamine 2-epimerase n=1 Tax=unclassified Clostridium TaxID=2614128 RepID=UPI000297879D|nr:MULTISPECIES: UDP-N-acetyl glucosamine 2-epimerase [unclassified Clostridium]EKQ51113.1 MAG: UDP-N-acetylglucosamine 2-epimerase [Clostridium sp. Maddingley MBC34-26]
MIDELLEFENNSEVLSFKYNFNEELIWPFFRFLIYQNVIYKKNGNRIQINKEEKKDNIFYDYIFKNPYLCRNKKILFLYGNTSNILNENGMYFNRLFDYYSFLYEKDTLMIEEEFAKAHERPRTAKNVKYQDFIEKIVEIRTNLNGNKYNEKDLQTTEEFLKYLNENFPFKFEKGFYEGLGKNILKLSIKIKYYNHYYRELIKNVNPKIIFFEDGCYGGKAYAIKLANELGITTAEFQHGYVGLEHPAYNYPQNMYENMEYKQYMPQYYLTFGQYWNDNIRLPVKVNVIGNPHLYSNLEKYKKAELNQTNDLKNYKAILFISCGNCFKDYIDLLENVLPRLDKKYKLIFRLHPLERNSKQIYDCLKRFNNIIINDDGDIYQYINLSEFIIGDSSTSVYEAVALKKKILVFEDSDSILYTSKKFGTWFKNADELIEILEDDNIQPVENIDYYWESKWKENYMKFINENLKEK